MEDSGPQELLRDARVLAWYAAHVGKLPPQSTIFHLIAKYENDPAPPPDLIVAMYAEMANISKAIAPTTLRHLLQRGSIIGWLRNFRNFFRHFLSNLTPFALGLLTLLLTLYLAFQSSQLNQADTAIREYQAWQDQQPSEKLYDAWKMYRYERVLNLKGPPLAQLDAYHKLEADSHQLVDKGAAIQTMLTDSGNQLYFPRYFENLGSETFRDFITWSNGDKLPDKKIQDELPSATAFASANAAAAKGAPAPVYLAVAPPDCKDEPLPISTNASATDRMQSDEIDAYMNSFECFLSHLHISGITLTYSPWSDIYRIKAKINLLVTWLLPGLYGLLGACVFLLRDLLLPRDARQQRDKRIITTLMLLLRVALGGLAGIIIGWFWVPAPTGNASTVVSPISSIPFGLAFMAGFSIDTLFTLLDRVNRTISGRDDEANLPRSTIKKPAPTQASSLRRKKVVIRRVSKGKPAVG